VANTQAEEQALPEGKRSKLVGEDYMLTLGGMKKLVLRKFKGNLLVDFREYWVVSDTHSLCDIGKKAGGRM